MAENTLTQQWAAAMRAEAGCLERAASSLEEVVVENEAAGYESWTEDMAADAYRRLAAYLRRDAAAAEEYEEKEEMPYRGWASALAALDAASASRRETRGLQLAFAYALAVIAVTAAAAPSAANAATKEALDVVGAALEEANAAYVTAAAAYAEIERAHPDSL